MRDPGAVLQATFDAFTEKLNLRDDFVMPRRQSIQLGEVAYECEELIVQGGTVFSGLPGERAGVSPPGNIGTHSFDVLIHLVRSYPTGDDTGAAPVPADLNRASLLTATDAVALSDVFWVAMSENLIAGPCDRAHFGGIEFVGPDGGLIGTMLGISVQL